MSALFVYRNCEIKRVILEFLSGVRKSDVLQPIITIVLYFGKQKWDGPCSLKDLLDMKQFFDQISEDVYDLISVMSHSNELKEKKEINRKGEMYQMCKAITDMIETSRNEGIEKGIEKDKVASVDKLQKNLGLNLHEACAALEISVEEYQKIKAFL